MKTRGIPITLAATGLLLGVAACGDDDDAASTTTQPATTTAAAATATTAGGDGSVDPQFAEYCALSRELDEQQSMPTAEQMQTILAAAPAEIADEAKQFVDAFVAAGDDVGPSIFGQFAEQLAVIDQFDAEHCGLPLDEEGAPDPDVITIDPAATRVDVAATDFHFEFTPPDTAGRYSFVMANDGEEDHMMILAQLEPGADLDEVLASEGEVGVLQEFGSVPSAAGDESVVTADLTPGHWVVLCPLPSSANGMQPHLALGMIHEWDVT